MSLYVANEILFGLSTTIFVFLFITLYTIIEKGHFTIFNYSKNHTKKIVLGTELILYVAFFFLFFYSIGDMLLVGLTSMFFPIYILIKISWICGENMLYVILGFLMGCYFINKSSKQDKKWTMWLILFWKFLSLLTENFNIPILSIWPFGKDYDFISHIIVRRFFDSCHFGILDRILFLTWTCSKKRMELLDRFFCWNFLSDCFHFYYD